MRISLKDILNQHYTPLRLSPEWRAFLGDPPANESFSMALWGYPGAGKSTLALMLCQEFSRYGDVLYVCAEEPTARGTIKKRAKEQGINSRKHKIEFFDCNDLDSLIQELDNSCPKFCIIDSVNTFKQDDIQIAELVNKYKQCNFFFVVQMNKDRRGFRGRYDWEHNSDIAIRCEVHANGDRYAINTKPRLGGSNHKMKLFSLPNSIPDWASRRLQRLEMTGAGAAPVTFRDNQLRRMARIKR